MELELSLISVETERENDGWLGIGEDRSQSGQIKEPSPVTLRLKRTAFKDWRNRWSR